MKWFKHHCDAGDGTSMGMLFSKFGHQGYAAYFLLIELVAAKYDAAYAAENGEKFQFTQRKLKEKLRISYTKLEVFLRFCSELDLFFLKKSGEIYEIEMPKLRSIQDNHTKNLQVAGKRPASDLQADKEKEKEEEGEKEKEKKIEKENSSGQKAGPQKKSPPHFSDAELELISHWNKHGPVKHSLDAQILKEVPKALKKNPYGIESLKKGIENYSGVLALGEGTWWTHKWNLAEFCKREKARDFYPENFIAENYLKRGVAKGSGQKNEKRVNPYAEQGKIIEADFKKMDDIFQKGALL